VGQFSVGANKQIVQPPATGFRIAGSELRPRKAGNQYSGGRVSPPWRQEFERDQEFDPACPTTAPVDGVPGST